MWLTTLFWNTNIIYILFKYIVTPPMYVEIQREYYSSLVDSHERGGVAYWCSVPTPNALFGLLSWRIEGWVDILLYIV